MTRRSRLTLTILAISFLGSTSSRAVDITWLPATGDWSLASNWSLNRLPTSSDNAIVTNGRSTIITASGAVCSRLYLGNDASGGDLEMSGGDFSTTYQFIGNTGPGSFTQSGGTNTMGTTRLGITSGARGTYKLSGVGIVSVSDLWVGVVGIGEFSQTGGTISITGDPNVTGSGLSLGRQYGSSATYTLSGTGRLSAAEERIGGGLGAALALFDQTSGTNSTPRLSIGTDGRYVLRGGLLEVDGIGVLNRGVFDGGNSPATLRGNNCIIDLSAGTCTNLGSLSINLGANSLVILPKDFDAATSFGEYVSDGVTYHLGSTLTVPAGKGFNGWTTINDFVSCAGSITAPGDGAINLAGGLTLSAPGRVLLSTGTLTVNDSVSGMSGGLLSAVRHCVGYSGTGAFAQSGGTSTFQGLSLGVLRGDDNGTYELSGIAVLRCNGEIVGQRGDGTFNQSGGTNTSATGGGLDLLVGGAGGSRGTYNLTAGLIIERVLIVGENGTGTFNHSGGTVSASSYQGLKLASDASAIVGTYNLWGGGQLFQPDEYIGYHGKGVFNQSGGTNTVSGTLSLGNYVGSSGIYNLDGGTLIVSAISKGSGTAAINFGGGTLNASEAFTTTVPMTLTGTGGNANVNTNNFAVTFSGGLSGPGGLNKLGGGKLTLGGANTYNGPTTITTGTLSLAGGATLSNSSVIDVAANTLFDVSALSGGFTLAAEQTLKGTGKVLGNLIVEGTHVPGASPGVTLVQGNYTLLGDLEIDMHGVFAGSGYDAIYQLGGVGPYSTTLAGTLSLDWTGFSGSSDTTKIWILRNLTQGTFSGTFSNYPNGAWLGSHDGRDWYLWCGADYATGNLTGGRDVLISTVPEPSTLALLAGALAAWVFARRRRTPAD